MSAVQTDLILVYKWPHALTLVVWYPLFWGLVVLVRLHAVLLAFWAGLAGCSVAVEVSDGGALATWLIWTRKVKQVTTGGPK